MDTQLAPATQTLPYWLDRERAYAQDLEIAEIRLSKTDNDEADKEYIAVEVSMLRRLVEHAHSRVLDLAKPKVNEDAL